MRAVVQRVSEASVTVQGRVTASVAGGLLVYVGVDRDDGESDARYIADKVRHLRIFPDEQQRLNRDAAAAGGAVLVVSAFTLMADARRGRRPTLEAAAPHDRGYVLYEMVCRGLEESGLEVQRGAYGEMMEIHSANAGPVCILLESRRLF